MLISDKDDRLKIATALTASWLSNPSTVLSIDDFKALLLTVDIFVTDVSRERYSEQSTIYNPRIGVVTEKESLASPDFIISMINGKPYKSIKRHLSLNGMSPAKYRAVYGLSLDYPMVSRNYSKARSLLAKKRGLGRNKKK